jgi:hypothetical protein
MAGFLNKRSWGHQYINNHRGTLPGYQFSICRVPIPKLDEYIVLLLGASELSAIPPRCVEDLSCLRVFDLDRVGHLPFNVRYLFLLHDDPHLRVVLGYRTVPTGEVSLPTIDWCASRNSLQRMHISVSPKC